VITSGIGWRGIFLVNVPIGIIAVAVTLWKVAESRPPRAFRPDWLGFVVLTAGLVSLVYGLIRADETHWSDGAVITCLSIGAVLLVVFVIVELRMAHPMFDLSLFRTPTFLGGSIAGLHGTSSWTHLIPGFIVAGIGSGMVNPPLASTAVGVVAPQRSGMASGINTTFRQIGIAVSIAVLGSIFTGSLQHNLNHDLSSNPALAGRGTQIAALVHKGDPGQAIQSVPTAERAPLAAAIRSSFASTMNDLLIVTALLALVGGVCALALIRREDFVAPSHQPAPVPAGSVENPRQQR
jgi:hypothetical protein